MAVVQGTVALASAYNTLRNSINLWYGDPNPSMIFGDGSQNWGWGGSMPPLVTGGALDIIEALEGNALIDRCNIGTDIVNGVSGTIAQVAVPNLISASEYNAIESQESLIAPARLDIDSAELSLNAGGTVVETSTWSTLLRIVVRYTWADFANARYFFNSGGAVNVSMVLSGGTTGNALSWANLFSAIGTITINYYTATESGSGGTPTGIGYYGLTTSWQQLYSASPGGYGSYASYSSSAYGGYSDNDLVINGRRSASGNYLELQIICNDDHTGSVDGTTTLTTQYRKLDNQTSGAASLAITAPAYSLQEQTAI